MTFLKPMLLLSEVAKRVNMGTAEDVDYFMKYLSSESPTPIMKMADFALSQINSKRGKERIKYYLNNGTKIQKKHAALYFKTHRHVQILKDAVLYHGIDQDSAFSK